MPQRVTYHDEQDVENTLKLREVLKTSSRILPGLFPGHGADDFHEDPYLLRLRYPRVFPISQGTKSGFTHNGYPGFSLWMCWISWKLLILRNIRNI